MSDASTQAKSPGVCDTHHQPLDADEFVATIQPIVARENPAELFAFVKTRWTGRQILELFRSENDAARKMAALCISMVGTPCCVNEVSKLLKDEQPIVNQLAEHALWSIWFRAGSLDANHEVARGAQAIERRDFAHAITHFDRAVELSPNFAEAYNQRAIAHFLMDQFQESLEDCRHTIDRMPQHFGAWAGAGHCHAHLGNIAAAISAYEMALSINPHLHAIEETITELRSRDDQH